MKIPQTFYYRKPLGLLKKCLMGLFLIIQRHLYNHHHHHHQVMLKAQNSLTLMDGELMSVNLCWPPNIGGSMCRSPEKNVAYEFILTSPAVPFNEKFLQYILIINTFHTLWKQNIIRYYLLPNSAALKSCN